MCVHVFLSFVLCARGREQKESRGVTSSSREDTATARSRSRASYILSKGEVNVLTGQVRRENEVSAR